MSLNCFDETLSAEDTATNILAGDYVLLTYAGHEWLEHVRKCAEQLAPDLLQSLRDLISTFADSRQNYFFQSEDGKAHPVDRAFHQFKEMLSAYDFLVQTDGFMWKRGRGLLEYNCKYSRNAPMTPLFIEQCLFDIISCRLGRSRPLNNFHYNDDNSSKD